jgi:hypothetical protein
LISLRSEAFGAFHHTPKSEKNIKFYANFPHQLFGGGANI